MCTSTHSLPSCATTEYSSTSIHVSARCSHGHDWWCLPLRHCSYHFWVPHFAYFHRSFGCSGELGCASCYLDMLSRNHSWGMVSSRWLQLTRHLHLRYCQVYSYWAERHPLDDPLGALQSHYCLDRYGHLCYLPCVMSDLWNEASSLFFYQHCYWSQGSNFVGRVVFSLHFHSCVHCCRHQSPLLDSFSSLLARNFQSSTCTVWRVHP